MDTSTAETFNTENYVVKYICATLKYIILLTKYSKFKMGHKSKTITFRKMPTVLQLPIVKVTY